MYEEKEGWWADSKRTALALGMLLSRGRRAFFNFKN